MARFFLEGNGGGDYLHLEQDRNQKKAGMVGIEVGHCCTAVGEILPVEVITAILHRYLLENAVAFETDQWTFSIDKLIDSCDWSDEYKKELKLKCKPRNSTESGSSS